MVIKKVLVFVLILGVEAITATAQKSGHFGASQLNVASQSLLLELSSTYFTVVKENEIDLDSSLIHVSKMLSVSRLPIVAKGLDDQDILNNADWVDQRKPLTGEKQLVQVAGRKHASLSVLLGAYFAFEPGNDSTAKSKGRKYLEQGIKECEEGNYYTLKLAARRLLGKLYLKDQNFSEADKLLSEVNNEFLKRNNQAAAAVTCSWWGLYAPVTTGSTGPRIKHIEWAAQLFRSIGEKEGLVNSLVNDSYLHMLSYDMASAEKLDKEALGIAESLRFPYTHYVTGALMSITMFQGKFGEPLAYAIESVKSAETTNDNIALPYFYGVVAVLYENEGDRDEVSIDWGKKSIDLFVREHEPCYMALNSMVTELLIRKRRAEALEFIKKVSLRAPPATVMDKLFYYLTIGLYSSDIREWAAAHKAYDQAASFENDLEKHGLSVRKPTILLNLAILYFKESKFNEARSYYRRYLAQPAIIKGGFLADKTAAYENLIKIDSLSGDKNAQLKDYRQFMNITLQNYTISKVRLAEELQVKYATEAKVNQINLLNQKAKLEQDNLQQANLTKNITIAGIVLVMVIAALLYRQAKARKNTNNVITRKNELMQKLLDEKEWLLKEVHHRVKNNLHTVICLLESQAIYLENDALKAVENSRHRIYAMSLIHQKLYQSEDIKVVDMRTYLTDFITYLEESFGSPEGIKIILAADPIKLGAGQAIPIGLIVNEGVTNAYKYAFPVRRNGEIVVTLKRTGDKIHLGICDNGIGFDEPSQEVNSLGLELIKGLTLDLRGEIILATENGTSINIIFKGDQSAISADLEEVLSKSR